MKNKHIYHLKKQKEILLQIKINDLQKKNDDLIYENNLLKNNLDYAKRNGGIKRLVLTK